MGGCSMSKSPFLLNRLGQLESPCHSLGGYHNVKPEELTQQTIDLIREQQLANIGAKLGVAAGFNALDGD